MADSRVPVWLDCDPGHDDVFAILLAAYHPSIRLLGISTVWGNASLEKTTQNACSILTAISKSTSVPVFAGAAHALYRPPMHAPTDIHGESGLDGTNLLPKPVITAANHHPGLNYQSNTAEEAVDAAAAALRSEPPGSAWVVATGSFTNVASLFTKYPELVGHVRGLSLMGGAIGGGFTRAVMGYVDGVPRVGNWTQYAEFNVLADPEAAQSIFGDEELAAKTTLIPLDLTHQVLATQEVRGLLLHGNTATTTTTKGYSQGKTELRTMLVELLMFFAKTYSDVFGITEGPPLHDPLAVAAVLAGLSSEIPFYDYDPADTGKTRERYEVSVITKGTYDEARAGARTGQTVAKLLPPGQEGVRIPRGLDIPMFWKVIEECVERADAANKAGLPFMDLN
ncbi:uridine nucleosidase Urh1 [Diplogelasinospora grovesii]|uniref:Uridine nucleosidase Urh1 n=1 Tax=Diplogelasinospora grovesii TaxID=303347 RepID=A0AAN6ND30_9PEZI|nr:uridine nucleosidase Urh1 [Diplogelasinospora grovesii]